MSETAEPCPACHPKKAAKPSYVGTPAIFHLELACKTLREAFGGFGPYLVGSSLERADWRDVDVRYLLSDDDFVKLFPNAETISGAWEFDPRWLWLSTSIAERLKAQTGLPIDFQFQPISWANARHDKPRHALGLWVAKAKSDAQ
jgi:hypothetical protein